jgi:uncharacterized membrane protein YdbT with pleckstrin-like domain
MADAYIRNLLGDREKILLVTRQHWFLLMRNILFELILIAVTVIAVSLVMVIWNPSPLTPLGYLIVLLPIASLVRDALVWSHHEYIVTNRRVVQIFGVFNKNVIDSSLEKVNDVKMEQSMFGRIFNFGDIEILTASELGINRFTFIGDPVGFKTAMLNAKYELEQNERPYGLPGGSQMMDVPRLIQELDALRRQGVISEEEFLAKKSKLLSQI